MAAKPADPDLTILSNLADHAHKLLHEFVDQPLVTQERGAELLAELEHVILEFKRLRPPPTFKPERRLHLVDPVRLCSVCSKPVDRRRSDYLETVRAAYHIECLDKPATREEN
jgi:hypothetical protein